MSHSVGETVVLDGIESVIIYDAGSEQSWGRYLCVDKNHDLSYYVNGSDWVDSNNYNQSPGTYGYEWGGFGITTGITDTNAGSGLVNTNSLISMNLQPVTSGWYIVWDKVSEFRNSYSDKWFVPSEDELDEVVNHQSLLENLSTAVANSVYWSSTEISDKNASLVEINSLGGVPDPTMFYKSRRNCRVRLCRYVTDIELNSKTVQILCSTPSSQIYYTADNSEPSSSSNLYFSPFSVNAGTTIKAIGIKEGYLDSDIATLTV